MSLKVVEFNNKTNDEARESMLHNVREVLRQIEAGDAMAVAFAVVDRKRNYFLAPANVDGYAADMCLAVRALDRECWEAVAEANVEPPE